MIELWRSEYIACIVKIVQLYCSQYDFAQEIPLLLLIKPWTKVCYFFWLSFDYHRFIRIIINTHLKWHYMCLLRSDSLIKVIKWSLSVFMQQQFTHTVVFPLLSLLDEHLVPTGLMILIFSDTLTDSKLVYNELWKSLKMSRISRITIYWDIKHLL